MKCPTNQADGSARTVQGAHVPIFGQLPHSLKSVIDSQQVVAYVGVCCHVVQRNPATEVPDEGVQRVCDVLPHPLQAPAQHQKQQQALEPQQQQQ